MPTAVRAKGKGDAKQWFLWSGELQKEYPQCDGFSRSEFYDTLREELSLPSSMGRSEVVARLMDMSWDGEAFRED